MIVTLVVDTFGINNNGTTISAMRFAESLTERGQMCIRDSSYNDY